MADKIERDHWHPAFVGAMEIEFIQYKGLLEFDEEHKLSREPLSMDLLVIKKYADAEVANEIGRMFRKFNVFEYKSPDDGLTIDDYIKTVGYAYLYKGQGKTVDEIPFDELTVTLVRDNMPDGLFESAKRLGGTVEDAERFIEMARKFTEPGDRHNADAVLQVSVSANREIYEKREKEESCYVPGYERFDER